MQNNPDDLFTGAPDSGLDPGFFDYDPGFIPAREADEMLELLREQLDWRQYSIRLFGKQVPQPRLTAWYGDPEASYKYSGLQLHPRPWHPLLAELRQRLVVRLQEPLNSVLANAYRDGADSMGWHADDEPELGRDPIVASVSLGAERRFLLRKRGERGSAGILLESGSLLVMKRGCQSMFQHALPKSARIHDLRINLTFRQITRPNAD